MLLQAIHSGCRSVLFGEFDPAGFDAAIGEHRITHAFLVPAMLLFMLQAPGAERGDYALMQVIVYGGSPISERGHLLRSAGRPAGGARQRIVDPLKRTDLPEGRNECGGWFRTGDAGYLKDGYLYIHDRVKDLIISGGENICPAEVGNVLMQHPAVADGAIIGVPDERWGEAVKTCVVLRPGTEAAGATEVAIIAFMRERLAPCKCPKTIDFVEALPRNPNGKLLKHALREPCWREHDRQVA
jgi:long-chain acyl-CoA synthetase